MAAQPQAEKTGAGRPVMLNKPVKKLFRLEPRHVKILERYAKTNKLSGGCNEAMRHILDTYDLG